MATVWKMIHLKSIDDGLNRIYNILAKLSKPDGRVYRTERSYMRKVRAPQGRVPGNSR